MWNFFNAFRAPKGRKHAAVVEYRLGRRFDPGAEAEVFEQVFENPVYIVSRGNGRIAGQFMVTQHPQVWVGPVIGVNGVGGVQAGQIYGVPLLDPSELDNSGG